MTDWGCHTIWRRTVCPRVARDGSRRDHPARRKGLSAVDLSVRQRRADLSRRGWDGILNFRGPKAKSREGGPSGKQANAPGDYIPNYKGEGGIFGDFLHCVRTRELPVSRHRDRPPHGQFVPPPATSLIGLNRHAEVGPRCGKSFSTDPEANRWLDRPKREPWSLS